MTALRAVTKEAHATLFMGLSRPLRRCSGRWAGQTDVVVGSPVAGRSRAELEPLIGFFVNALVLRLDCAGELGFRDLVGRAREVCVEAYAHQDAPSRCSWRNSVSSAMLLATRSSRSASRSRTPEAAAPEQPTAGRVLAVERGTAIFDLSVHV